MVHGENYQDFKINKIKLCIKHIEETISLLLFNFLGTSPVPLANVGALAFQRKLDLKLQNGHCLLPFWIASTTAAVNLTGTIYFVNK